MLNWLRRAFRPVPEPLSGAPPVRRLKTYSAESGHVYQYQYEGSRGVPRGREYVFEATSGRGPAFRVSVLLREAVIDEWQLAHGRALTHQERFAIATLSLKRAFDERASPIQMQEQVDPTSEAVGSILSMLGID